MAAPDFGIFGFGPQAAGVGDTVSFDYFQLDGPDPSGCECDAPGPVTSSPAARSTRRAGTRSRTTTRRSTRSSNGALQGHDDRRRDLPGRSTGRRPADPAGGRPRRRRTACWRPSSTNTLDGGYSQGGILVYGADNDYVKINAISDDGQGRVNRLELRSEVGGA